MLNLSRTLQFTALTLVLASGLAQAQSYPNRPVKIVVPFAAGGPADNYARFMAQRLGEELKQTFVIDNKPGAGSIIGTDLVAKSPADGYTLLMMSNTHTVNESLIATKPFGLMKDFVGIAPVNYSNLLLVVHPSVPVKSVNELVALAKSKPGKLNYASSGNGTPYHMAGELFKFMAGIDMTHVPYKGSSGARTDIVGGQVDVMFDAETTMAALARDGKVRTLAGTGLTRSANLQDLPTVSETVPKFEATIWLGLMAPKGTPADVVSKLNAEVRKIVNNPEVKAAWAKQGAVPMSMSVPEFDQYLNAYIAKVSQEKGVALPPLTEALPERIAQPTLSLLLTLVPTDATPYLNALTWMNTQLSTAQQGLSSMMKPVEGFIWARMKGLPQAHVQEAFATCDEIAKCMDARDQAKQASQEQELVRRLTTFQNPALQTAMKENKRLVEKSEQIQKQAQSGELLSKFSLPTAKEISVPLIAPEGGSRLSELQKSDPAKYKSLQQQGGSMFALKGLMEQINRTI